MQTVTQLLTDMASGIAQDGATLLARHSRLTRNPPSRGVIVLGGGTHSWGPLSVEGRRLQSQLRDEYDRFNAVLTCLLRTQLSSIQDELLQTTSTITDLIDQQSGSYFSGVEETAEEFRKAIGDQIGLLSGLFDGADGDHVYVPDTNALIFNPQLEEWHFDESPTFVLLLMPTVLSELDSLKVNGRTDAVRDKANSLIRQLMEFRRRGSLNEGVVVRKGRHRLRTIAIEPDFQNSLPWLDRNNNDDRLLAGFIEAMRQHPRCPVVLVTRDINLTNKADYARIPCVLPPELPTQ